MRAAATLLALVALGLMLGGAVTIGILAVLSALACDLIVETFDAQ